VRRTLSEDQHTGRLNLTEPKTSRSRRRVDLPARALEALRAHRERLGAVPHPERLIFTDSEGGPSVLAPNSTSAQRRPSSFALPQPGGRGKHVERFESIAPRGFEELAALPHVERLDLRSRRSRPIHDFRGVARDHVPLHRLPKGTAQHGVHHLPESR